MSTRALDDPVLERRRLEALGLIRQYGDPVLRTPAETVSAFDEALRDDAERMSQIMRDARGVGLAAPQIGRLSRLVVIRPYEDGPTHTLVNPVVAWRSEDEETDVEGCLSIGEILVEVPRPVSVRITAQDTAGHAFELELEGFPARVAQHEIDHLDGRLILDRTTREQRSEALKALRAAAR
jgi:peptide deformylase